MTSTSKLSWSGEFNFSSNRKHQNTIKVKDRHNQTNSARSKIATNTLISKENHLGQHHGSVNENSKSLHHPWNKQAAVLYSTGTSHTSTPKLITSPPVIEDGNKITRNTHVYTKGAFFPSVITNSIIFAKSVYLVSKSFLSNGVLSHHPSRTELLSKGRSPIVVLSSELKLNSNSVSVNYDEYAGNRPSKEDKLKLGISITGRKYFYQNKKLFSFYSIENKKKINKKNELHIVKHATIKTNKLFNSISLAILCTSINRSFTMEKLRHFKKELKNDIRFFLSLGSR